MALRPFRLTYIDARRLCGVAGFEQTLLQTQYRSLSLGRACCRDLTESSRAIHGRPLESQILERGERSPRFHRHTLVLGSEHHRNTEPNVGRAVGGRGSHRDSDGQLQFQLAQRRRHDPRDSYPSG